jgi:hypothetical protein
VTPNVVSDLGALEATRRRGSLIVIAGIALLGAGGALASVYTAKLTKDIGERQATIRGLDADIVRRNSEIEVLRAKQLALQNQKDQISKRADSLESALNVTLTDRMADGDATSEAPPSPVKAPKPAPTAGGAPIVTELRPSPGAGPPPAVRASVRKLAGQVTSLPGSVQQLYEIDMWLDAASEQLSTVERVTYDLSRYYRIKPRLTSESRNDGYRVTTKPLWGCIGTVLVTVTDKQGRKRELVVDWCRAANWENRER